MQQVGNVVGNYHLSVVYNASATFICLFWTVYDIDYWFEWSAGTFIIHLEYKNISWIFLTALRTWYGLHDYWESDLKQNGLY